jgi:hypothetical protein
MSSQGHGEMTKYFWMFTKRGTGTEEGRQIRKYLGHNFTSKAGSVPWQDKMIL